MLSETSGPPIGQTRGSAPTGDSTENGLSALDPTIRKAQDHLLSLQHEDGYWWAGAYRIANFSLGSPNISSRAKTLDKPHDLMFGRERPSHYRPTCEHSNKSRSASSHHPSQEHRGCDNHRRVSPRLNSILGHGLAESPSKTPPAGRTVTNDEMKPARLALHGAMNAFYVVQGTLRARFLGGSDL